MWYFSETIKNNLQWKCCHRCCMQKGGICFSLFSSLIPKCVCIPCHREGHGFTDLQHKLRQKGRDLFQSHDKSHYKHKKSKKHKNIHLCKSIYLYLNHLVSVTASGLGTSRESPRVHVGTCKSYGQFWLIGIVLEHQNFPCLNLTDIVILWIF